MATTPMVSPNGQIGDIPTQNVGAAVAKGFKVGQELIAPSGQHGVVPLDAVHAAIQQGFQIAPPPAPKPANPILQDDANQPRYADIVGPNGGPGAPGEAENANDTSIVDLGKGILKGAASDLINTTPNFLLNKQQQQEREAINKKLAPQNTAEETGATTQRAAATSLAIAGVPELLENIAGLIRGAKSGAGILGQLVHGEEVAQPAAQAAVRGAVKSAAAEAGTEAPAAAETAPLLEGNSTILDDHLDALAKQEKAAYQRVDDTAGFDLKNEKRMLSNDRYKLQQLGNTDADVTQRAKLIESINDSEDRISTAQQQLKDAGLDPAEPDTIHKSRMAGQDFRKALIQATSPDGETVNVDSLLNAAKKMRFSKYGDRLAQFMGDDGADAFMEQLMQAQEMGAHAVKARKVAAWLSGSIAGLSALGEGAKALHVLGGQ